MLKLLSLLLGLCLIVYIGVGVYLYTQQRTMIFYPTQDMTVENQRCDFLDTGEATLKICMINPGKANAILYFGGNAEATIFNTRDFTEAFPNKTVYLTNYRGYGGSTGTPSERAFFADAIWLYDHFKPKHRSMSVIGRSIGSGVATYLAANREIRRLVLVTPFDSFLRIAKEHFPIYPLSLMLKDKFESYTRAAMISAPTLILIAENDQLVSRSHSMALAKAFTEEQVRVEILEGTDHNDISSHPNYFYFIAPFIE